MDKNRSPYHIVQRDAPTMYFIGVTTAQSAMMRLFPLWAEVLGLDGAQLIGVDLPLQADPEQYRQVVAQIKYDPLSLGALITTHKIDLFDAAADLFDEFDSYAQLCHEVSSIVKRNDQLIGAAKDAVMSGQALQAILGPQYWRRSSGHVLCLGVGGAGIAIAANLLTQPNPHDRPQRLVVVNDQPRGLAKLRAIVEQLSSTVKVEYILNEESRKNDDLMSQLPPGSLIINATGMGKDRPGSPISDEGTFPMHSIVWDLNYRGKLDFLRQARAQAQQRDLKVHDGWHYFTISLIDHIADTFNQKIAPEQSKQLVEKAGQMRP